MAILSLRPYVAAALLLAVASAWPAVAQVQLIEQKIKAGLLYNFLRYTEWPAEHLTAEAPVVVCLLGGDLFDGNLQPMAGRTVNQHAIEIRKIAPSGAVDACSMVVIHASQSPNWPELRKALAGKSAVTVSDFDGFAEAGGMIEFARVANRVTVKINPDAMNAARLNVDDRLLKLASAVRTAPER